MAAPACEMLGLVKPDSVFHVRAQALLAKLSRFERVEMKHIPYASLLREFLGKSSMFEDNVLD